MTKVDSFLDVFNAEISKSKRSWGWIPTSAGLMYRKTHDCEPANPSRWSGPRHDITLRHSLALIGCPWLLLWRVLPLLHYREAWTPAGKTAPGEHSSHYTHVDGVAVTHTPRSFILISLSLWNELKLSLCVCVSWCRHVFIAVWTFCATRINWITPIHFIVSLPSLAFHTLPVVSHSAGKWRAICRFQLKFWHFFTTEGFWVSAKITI